MSEFSTSFHIRTTDAPAIEKRLAKAGYQGLVFGPANGWLTFIPYATDDTPGFEYDGDSYAAKLVDVAAMPILAYSYAEDHGWSFALVRPGKPISRFFAQWDPEPEIGRESLDLMAFADIASSSDLEPFLLGKPRDETDKPLAYCFAEKVGLPAFRWLSPLLVASDAKHFLNNGARRLGARRRNKSKKPSVPDPIEVDVPKSELSAREALALLTPHMLFLSHQCVLWNLNGHSHVGRSASDWTFSFVNTETREVIRAALFTRDDGKGRCSFQAGGRIPVEDPFDPERIRALIETMRSRSETDPMIGELEAMLSEPLPTRQLELPTNWLDSEAIAAIVNELTPPPEMPASWSALFSLSWERNPEPRWCCSRAPINSTERWSWHIEIDAVLGKVLYESLSELPPNDYIYTLRKKRIKGGPWASA